MVAVSTTSSRIDSHNIVCCIGSCTRAGVGEAVLSAVLVAGLWAIRCAGGGEEWEFERCETLVEACIAISHPLFSTSSLRSHLVRKVHMRGSRIQTTDYMCEILSATSQVTSNTGLVVRICAVIAACFFSWTG